MLTRAQKEELIGSRRDWWHSIDVGEVSSRQVRARSITGSFSARRRSCRNGWLGFACSTSAPCDGFFAFERERRGADVVAIDIHPEGCRCFAAAKRLPRSRMPYYQIAHGLADRAK